MQCLNTRLMPPIFDVVKIAQCITLQWNIETDMAHRCYAPLIRLFYEATEGVHENAGFYSKNIRVMGKLIIK